MMFKKCVIKNTFCIKKNKSAISVGMCGDDNEKKSTIFVDIICAFMVQKDKRKFS